MWYQKSTTQSHWASPLCAISYQGSLISGTRRLATSLRAKLVGDGGEPVSVSCGAIRGTGMQKVEKVDFSKLLGFEMLGDEVSGSLEFQYAAVDAKLGAKVGAEHWVACEVTSEFPANIAEKTRGE